MHSSAGRRAPLWIHTCAGTGGECDASIDPDVTRWRDLNALIGITVQLVAQRTDRDAEDVRRVRTVATAVLQRLENQLALDIRDRPPDERRRSPICLNIVPLTHLAYSIPSTRASRD